MRAAQMAHLFGKKMSSIILLGKNYGRLGAHGQGEVRGRGVRQTEIELYRFLPSKAGYNRVDSLVHRVIVCVHMVDNFEKIFVGVL